MMYLAQLTVAPGRATRKGRQCYLGSDTSGRTKLNMLIIELYGIAGVKNIIGCDLFMCCNVDLCMY